MISKAQIKRIASLRQEKFRQSEQVFVVEGEKMLSELMRSTFDVQTICATEQWLQSNTIPQAHSNAQLLQASPEDLQRISSLTTPNNVLAVVRTTKPQAVCTQVRLVLALDGINSPGNLGTIVRQALWFGLTDIVCSPNTVSIYNPKSVQATMG